MGDPLLEMHNISKRFPGVWALRDVQFSVDRGEIVCLLGENGAGKSTLMKILTGVLPEFEGTLRFEGRPVRFRNTREAFEAGISIVFQEFNLCPNLPVMENLFLGNEVRAGWGFLSRRRMREKARQAFQNLRTDIDPEALVKDLGVAQQQMVEVAKALAHQTKILIMDEPTSALADAEIQNLFAIMRDLKSRGISMVFISHKLREVLEIADRIVCLKDGRNSGEITSREATEDRLIALMVGRELDQLYSQRRGTPSAEVALEVRNLSGPPIIRDVSFSIRRGEILGLAGLIGAGRTELARLLIGAERKTAGQILLDGRPAAIRHPADAVACGMAYASEDRKTEGLVLGMTVRENATMSIHERISTRAGFIRRTAENAIADAQIAKLQIKVSDREQITRNLSGGNQQKVVLAKCLAIRPRVLILDEPTRGIDVGAKAEVHKIIADLADEGVAVLVISSELPELLHLCDRILVMHEGRLTADLPRDQADEESIMKAAVA
ncbi:MAG: sugar ABC transporter ATP-binding protein [Candidatus Sumerlaeia bacterium]|nr:sugar ABC transporter ATP-binding protein [Candidatus Sumerlaeia bacterium]